MNHIKRLLAVILLAAVAVATRTVVRYGVNASLNWVQSNVDHLLNGADAKPKPSAKKSTKAKSPQQVAQQIAPGGTNGQSAPAQQGGAALGPSAPLGAGPINAARNAAGAANNQLREQTGQDVPPPKGAKQTPVAEPATPPANAPVVQQGAPKASASGTSTAAVPGAPADSRTPAKVVEAPPGIPGVPVAGMPLPNARAGNMLDTATKGVLRESFDYARDSRRDPFISLMTTNDLRPTLTDLKLTGILYDLAARRPVAVLRDVAGGQWRVTTGMTLGRMRVAQIKPKVIVFTIEEFGFNRQDSLVLGDTTRVRSR